MYVEIFWMLLANERRWTFSFSRFRIIERNVLEELTCPSVRVCV
jgi:hypothetical protein